MTQFAVGSSWQRQPAKHGEVPQELEVAPQELEVAAVELEVAAVELELVVEAAVEQAHRRHWQPLLLMHKHTPCWRLHTPRQAMQVAIHPIDVAQSEGSCRARAQVGEARRCR